MCYVRLDFLLAFLELSSADGDPVENPSPWSWPKWQEVQLAIDVRGPPPWTSIATFEDTGLQQGERNYCREFVVAYHAAGHTSAARRAFAMSLEEGPAYKGLCHLGWWCGTFQPRLEAEVDRILKKAHMITGGAQTILQIGNQNPYIVIATLADGLLGARAYEPPSELAYAWMAYTASSFRARWQVIYNTRMRFVDHIPRMLYAACQGVSSHVCCASDIEHYFQTLRILLVELDFNLHIDREKQRNHYRQLLLAVLESIDGGRLTSARTSVCLPPNMSKALALMEVDRIPGLRRILADCSANIEAGADYVLEEQPDEFDAFSDLVLLRVCTLLPWDLPQGELDAFVALESDLSLSESLSGEWQDEDRAAFLFTISSLPRTR